MTENDTVVSQADQPRYTRLLEFKPENAAHDCPVLAERGGVLLDRRTGRYFLQLKLRNQGGSHIRAVRLAVQPVGEGAVPTEGRISVPYSGLDCPPGGDFGAKRLIPLYQPNAHRFQVAVEEVSLDDGSVLRFSAPKPRPKGKPAPPPKAPTAVGMELDRVLDKVTPSCIARHIADHIPKEDAPMRQKVCRAAVAVLGLCIILCLSFRLALNRSWPYTGFDMILGTLTLEFPRPDLWGQAIVTVCTALSLFCLVCCLLPRTPVFRRVLPVTELAAFLAVVTVLYYLTNVSTFLLFGAFLQTLLYLFLFAASLYGRAAELAAQADPDPAFSEPALHANPLVLRGLLLGQGLFWLFVFFPLAGIYIQPIGTPVLLITAVALALTELRSRRAVTACKLLFLCDLAAGAAILAYSLSYSRRLPDLLCSLCCLVLAVFSPLRLHRRELKSLEETV